MLGRTDSRARLLILIIVLGVFGGALGLRLAYWQIGQGDDLRHRAEEQLEDPAQAQTRRGEILDASGAVLATTAYRDRLAAYPDLLSREERRNDVRLLVDILGLNGPEQASLEHTFESKVPYAIVSRRLTVEQSQQIRQGLRDGDLVGLDLEPIPMRFYPNNGGSPDTTLASQLLGFVTDDGEGRYGIEQFGQDLLAGSDAATADLTALANAPALPSDGGEVRLTINASLQLRLEKELYAAWVANKSPRVSGIVMDPNTGAILAWASVPGYNANEYANTAEKSPELFTDPLVSEVYEPGSVMKLFTAAAALEEGVVTLQSPVADGRVLRIGPNEVRNGDHDSVGVVPFEDIIAKSRNVGTGRVALTLGDTTEAGATVLYNMWHRLGIGEPTGIELQSESSGIVADPADDPWQAIDLVNRSFGQGVAITPLQLATAFCAMVNGGGLPHPHVVGALGDEAVTVPDPEQVMETSLSDKLRQLMVHVVETGPHYAEETLIPNYTVGGKTGTAQIWDPRTGDWMPDTYNHSFVGFVGGDEPEAVILVRIHNTEPTVQRKWGRTLEMTSNALFRRVAQDVISVLEIPPVGSAVAEPTPTDPATSSERHGR